VRLEPTTQPGGSSSACSCRAATLAKLVQTPQWCTCASIPDVAPAAGRVEPRPTLSITLPRCRGRGRHSPRYCPDWSAASLRSCVVGGDVINENHPWVMVTPIPRSPSPPRCCCDAFCAPSTGLFLSSLSSLLS